MALNETLIPIEGVFTCEEAKEILMNLFVTKINFHELKNLSSNERNGKNDEIAQKRIPALKNEIEKLHEVLSKAKNKKLVIKSAIVITIVED